MLAIITHYSISSFRAENLWFLPVPRTVPDTQYVIKNIC